MPETKRFRVDVILSVVTGMYLCDDLRDVHKLLDWMTGKKLYAHQLPQARRDCLPHILQQYPELGKWVPAEEIEISKIGENKS